MLGKKHWNRVAIKYLDTLMEGMVNYQRLGDLKLGRSAGTGVVTVLPGNREEFLR